MRWVGERVLGFVVAASVAVQGCARHHGPRDSTETGNPPVIDASRVVLALEGSDVHVRGEKGAVSPGGVTIRVRNLASDARASGTAAQNGSFDVKAPGRANEGFSVQASSNAGTSKPVFATQDVTLEGAGKDGALSCQQQTQLADVQTRAATLAADTTCAQDDDCVEVSTATVCLDTCTEVAVSTVGQEMINAVVDSINAGVCRNHEEAGCMTGVRFCPADPLPHMLICAQGHCVREGADAGANNASSDAGLSRPDAGPDAGTDAGSSNLPSSTPCGPTLTCDTATQICVVSQGFPPATYACQTLPPGCEHDRSCGCTADACPAGFDACQEAGANSIDCVCLGC